MGMKRDAKVIQLGNYEELEKALHVWFLQKQVQNVEVSGPLLSEKALELAIRAD